ncbi:MAG: hypothetical protein ACI4XH_03560 [Acutalibacteraceae bacterium]
MGFQSYFKKLFNNINTFKRSKQLCIEPSNKNEQFEEDLEDIKRSNKTIAFFDKYGVLYDLYPKDENCDLYEQRNIAYSAQYIVIFSKIYNLLNPNDIKAIPTPDYSKLQGSVTLYLEYILRMHRGRTDNIEIEKSLALKTAELMNISVWYYGIKEYMPLCNSLMKLDDYETSDMIFNNAFVALKERKKRNFYDRISGHDLIVASYHDITCEICSKYQNRVYSISGKDKRFPKLPNFVFKYYGFHEDCHHGFDPFYYYNGCKLYKFVNDSSEKGFHNEYYDAIEYSNRPFVDERSTEEKELYLQKKINEKSVYEEYEQRKTYYKKRNKQVKEYLLIKDIIPEKAPKSYSGYARMKSMNTENYKKLIAELNEKGIDTNFW